MIKCSPYFKRQRRVGTCADEAHKFDLKTISLVGGASSYHGGLWATITTIRLIVIIIISTIMIMMMHASQRRRSETAVFVASSVLASTFIKDRVIIW